MTAYYNENDPEAVAALRQLIADGVIASGEVDPRSIKDVTADDLRGFTQCHFFAGAGLWSVAARLAGWPDDRALWSASCPCQPFSSAGARLGTDDPRHLWPDLYRIVRSARAAGFGPPVLVGEQIAGSAGYGWFDGVRADLAREEIAARPVDIPACAIDAPHERNRLWWLAVADAESFRGGREQPERRSEGRTADGLADAGGVLADRDRGREWGHTGSPRSTPGASEGAAWPADGHSAERGHDPRRGGNDYPRPGRSLEHAAGERRGEGGAEAGVQCGRPAVAGANLREQQHRPNGSWWADAEWIECHDGKARRAKPGIPMLVDGMVGRASVWRLAGNSIVPQLAAEVIAAFLDAEAGLTAHA